jgi:cell division septal protein FtsQ
LPTDSEKDQAPVDAPRPLERPSVRELDRRPHLDASERLLNRAGTIERRRRWVIMVIAIVVALLALLLIVFAWPYLEEGLLTQGLTT